MLVDNRYDLTTTSFFIDPILFYEWYVYDILKDYAKKEEIKVLFDKNGGETTTKYQLVSVNEKIVDKSSKPDYLLVNDEENVKIVIDTKWKNVYTFGDIKPSDYLKLKFDSSLVKKDEYKTMSYLVYPNFTLKDDRFSIKVDNSSYFDFGTFQIDMNFDDEKNSLDFSYDYKLINETIKADKRIEILKTSAEQLCGDVKEYRTSTITKLLTNETFEDKEDVFAELDEYLLESTSKLSKEVDEYISDHINDILNDYEDVLAKESIRFLKSSSSIYNYYKDKNYE
ncbi:hypothetical protein [Sulfurimonas sp.]|uniref:5-methylcytosine restriction system specificity protein McrC n=1 Tax=Sulfurimonas sp. TaxID=2022749 RepID=UPI0025D56089|nr:hypothetical protein [Sulfurimonas sp.]